MANNKIVHDKPNCIGCGSCAAIAEDFWEMEADGKSHLKGSKAIADGKFEREIEDKDLAINKDAAESCPVNVIHIIGKDGKKLV